MAAQTYTNATALAAAIALAQAASPVDADLVAKLTRMAEVAAKPKAKTSGPTKAQLVNLGFAKRVAAFVWDQAEASEEGEGLVTSKVIVTSAGIAEIASTQKATSLLGIAADNGWVVRKEIKSRIYWGAGEVDPR